MNKKLIDLRDSKKLRPIIDVILVAVGLISIVISVYGQPVSALPPSQTLSTLEETDVSIATVEQEKFESNSPLIPGEELETLEEPVFRKQELFKAQGTLAVSEGTVTMAEEKTNVEEEAEVQNVEEIQSHPYYYVIDEGYEFYLDHDVQDYLWDLLEEEGHEERFELYMAQLYHESQFEYDQVSSTGDHGIAQINECNHGWLKKQLGITNFLDPYQSIKCQVYIMKSCFEQYDDVERALICYNRGNAIGVYSTDYSVGVLQDKDKLVEEK